MRYTSERDAECRGISAECGESEECEEYRGDMRSPLHRYCEGLMKGLCWRRTDRVAALARGVPTGAGMFRSCDRRQEPRTRWPRPRR
jgi:hypothetical protein